MRELTILAASTKTTLLEISNNADALGTGLQNAAPAGIANSSAQYLISTAKNLRDAANSLESLFPLPHHNVINDKSI